MEKKEIKADQLRANWKADVENGYIQLIERPIIPYAMDLMQEVRGPLEAPEIRVWCHPHRVGKSGDDGYATFPDFKSAIEFINGEGKEEGCEDVPLIAFRGYEINIYDLPTIIQG